MSVAGREPAGANGALAIVLHTHMPYVEGFGTWPFGEEWLWEAIATCYLPLLDMLDAGAPLTLSLTPVLCDQLEAPGASARFARFIEEVRRHTHEEDAAGLRATGHDELAREVDRAWGDYGRALENLERRDGDLLGAFAPHAQWTSSATHAVLPLLATDAGVRLQVQTGVRSHRRRFGDWRGGFWLPECAHAPTLELPLEQAGVSAVCVELTSRLGLGAGEHLRPLATETGLTLAPIDRDTVSLVWSDDGYPASPVYRDYHHHTVHHHNPWDNGGGVYDHPRAVARARSDAADFVSRTIERLRRGRREGGSALPGGGLVVCALDTELLGHWWYEGIAWLAAVVDECTRQGLELLRLDDALERTEPVAAREVLSNPVEPSSWGTGGDLSTWSGPAVSDMAFAARAAELGVLASDGAPREAVRALLALQASDWPFMVSRGLTVPYAHERFHGHRLALQRALDGAEPDPGALRNLAVDADPALLLAP
ncbi:MAG TPA: 1,4-alpha-glucan branching protein domain-containing protein [Solirubrobacteraceae bacterium]